jgi:hypothetical protein
LPDPLLFEALGLLFEALGLLIEALGLVLEALEPLLEALGLLLCLLPVLLSRWRCVFFELSLLPSLASAFLVSVEAFPDFSSLAALADLDFEPFPDLDFEPFPDLDFVHFSLLPDLDKRLSCVLIEELEVPRRLLWWAEVLRPSPSSLWSVALWCGKGDEATASIRNDVVRVAFDSGLVGTASVCNGFEAESITASASDHVLAEFSIFNCSGTSWLVVIDWLNWDGSERNMSIVPLMDPLGSVLLVVGFTSATTEVAEASEKLGNQDLGSDSTEQPTKRITKAITGRLLLDLVCIFL